MFVLTMGATGSVDRPMGSRDTCASNPSLGLAPRRRAWLSIMRSAVCSEVLQGIIWFHDLEAPRHYVQLEVQGHGDGAIYGEVGSREWTLPTQPLFPGSLAALQTLGFTGGGRGNNYRADGLFPDPHSLAQLTLRLFATAYPESKSFLLGILFKSRVSAKACVELLEGQNRSSFGG